MNNTKSRKSLFKTIILLFAIGLLITAFVLATHGILHEKELSAKTLFEIIGAALGISLPIVGFINFYIKKEIDEGIEKEKVKLLEQTVNPLKNQLKINDLGDVLETTTDILNTMELLPNLSISEKEEIKSIINQLEALRITTQCYKVIEDWLEKPDKIRLLSKDSGNLVLKNHPFTTIEIMFLKKSKYPLYQSIYDCLTWIKCSVKRGDYLTNDLPKIFDKKRTIKALNWIKTDILPIEIPESSVKELEIYFDELIQLIN